MPGKHTSRRNVHCSNLSPVFRFQCLVASVLAAAAVASSDLNGAVTNNYYNEQNDDGTYSFGYDTSNGIYVRESGHGGKGASGSVAYYAPDGTPIQLTWTADENGFRPQGAHLPTPPPVPKTIMSALDYLRYTQTAQQQPQQQLQQVPHVEQIQQAPLLDSFQPQQNQQYVQPQPFTAQQQYVQQQ